MTEKLQTTVPNLELTTETTRPDPAKLGPPRIFVEVIREIEGGGELRTRKEISLEVFHRSRFPVGDYVINECLGEMKLYG